MQRESNTFTRNHVFNLRLKQCGVCIHQMLGVSYSATCCLLRGLGLEQAHVGADSIPVALAYAQADAGVSAVRNGGTHRVGAAAESLCDVIKVVLLHLAGIRQDLLVEITRDLVRQKIGFIRPPAENLVRPAIGFQEWPYRKCRHSSALLDETHRVRHTTGDLAEAKVIASDSVAV